MGNHEIAAVLEEIADILEIQEDNPFRVRSYRRAAEAVGHAPFPIGVDTLEEDLRGIPGIGEAIAKKILEIALTGTCDFREQLLESFQVGLLEVLRVPGVGPKKAALFHREAQVNDLLTLEQAARDGRLAALKGMGKRSEEKILEGIELLKRMSGRITLGAAEEIVARLVDALGGPDAVLPAGSFRRGRETVGDLDLITAEQNAGAMEALRSLPETESVVASGDTKCSIVGFGGLQVDLRLIPRRSLGAACQYFTGSKQHNVRLREIAQERGLRLNEYGLFDAGNPNTTVAGETEEGIYAALGLPFIPPELREDAGEIEAGSAGALPIPLQRADLRGDLHCHSTWSDGAHTIEQMAVGGATMGWDYIVLTDHSKALGVANGLTEERLLAQIEEVRALNERGPSCRVLAGVEVDILSDGRLDLAEEVLDQLDFVVASVHSALGQPAETITARMVRAALNPHLDMIAHPLGRVLGRREEVAVDFAVLLDACVEGHTALEMNCSPDRLDLPDVRARMAAARGVWLGLGTDSHATHHQPNVRFGVTAARRGWVEPRHLLNCLSAEELVAWARPRA